MTRRPAHRHGTTEQVSHPPHIRCAGGWLFMPRPDRLRAGAHTRCHAGGDILPYGQKHRMPRAVASYANRKIIVCQWRATGSPVKKQWWRLQPPPLHSIYHSACHRRGRRSSHLSQRDFLHRAADPDDIDTVTEAADTAIRAAIHTPATGGIHLDHRRRHSHVAALDGYCAVNHLNYHF